MLLHCCSCRNGIIIIIIIIIKINRSSHGSGYYIDFGYIPPQLFRTCWVSCYKIIMIHFLWKKTFIISVKFITTNNILIYKRNELSCFTHLCCSVTLLLTCAVQSHYYNDKCIVVVVVVYYIHVRYCIHTCIYHIYQLYCWNTSATVCLYVCMYTITIHMYNTVTMQVRHLYIIIVFTYTTMYLWNSVACTLYIHTCTLFYASSISYGVHIAHVHCVLAHYHQCKRIPLQMFHRCTCAILYRNAYLFRSALFAYALLLPHVHNVHTWLIPVLTLACTYVHTN